jgi:ATP-dependent exoDNAse (exonuclease V) beta subunit
LPDCDEVSVKPGYHLPEKGKRKIVWWDPAALDLNAPENFGLRHINLLKPEGNWERGLQDYQNWREQRAVTRSRSSAPGLDVRRVTELEAEAPSLPVTLEKVGARKRQRGGIRFGTLVHGVLRDAAWDATAEHLSAIAALHEGSPEEREAAVEAAAYTLRHSLIGRAARSSRCHRELPILLHLPTGRVLEGVIDLAFVENDRWIAVDYKTDDFIELSLPDYENQLRWYMHALTELTGMPSEGVLLQV